MDAAAAVLRRARQHAGLSQGELGVRAGLSQSVISAYEAGRREPSFAQVARILAAAGSELTLTLRADTGLDLVRAHREELIGAFAALGGRNIRVFGSVGRGDERPGSDVDLLIDIDDSVTLISLGKMESAAERILRRPVDVVPASSLKADVRAAALKEAVSL